MYRKIHALLLLALLAAGVTAARPVSALPAEGGFADQAFLQLWQRSDLPVETGGVARSWVWGERAGERRYERYHEAAGGARLVQYFDKARMELTNPAGDRGSAWFVTNGLLVVELISGQLQAGNQLFEHLGPAQVPLAGDPIHNPGAPTYAMLRSVASIDGGNRAAQRIGQQVSATFGPSGVGSRADLALPETTIVAYDDVTGHNLPRVFHDFMNAEGPVFDGSRIIRGRIVDPLFAFGHPISEPYWARVVVGGVQRDVLFQAFERRVLTFTPDNPVGWTVEMGNVGQHYYRWRYGRALRYALPPLPAGVVSWETRLTIPTYSYDQALVPTAPGDPIYPYPRLDRSRVGPPEPRSYSAVVVENRFLRLTFLPELGGRLYMALDKSTGHNLFYQNPVIKPSTFGQRGWWIGAGGLEWAAPTEEHGYLEYLPWDLTLSSGDDALNARVTTTERQSGMTVAGTVGLRADEGRFSAALEVHNPTTSAHALQMWTNAALSPGGANDVGPGVKLIAPTDQVIVHATNDPAIPGPHSLIGWPRHNGRDLSMPATWNGYFGFFAPEPVPFIAAYDLERDEGAAVIHGAGASGAKLFSFSRNFDRNLYTDDQSEYLELWSGAQTTFWDYPPLAPGASRGFTTTWLPLWGLGDLVSASEGGALGLERRSDGGLTVTLSSARITSGEVVVRMDGREVFRSQALELRPDLPLAIDLSPAASEGSRLQVEAPGLTLGY